MESDEYKKLYSLLSELALKGKIADNNIMPENKVVEKPVDKTIIKMDQEEIHLIPVSEIVPRKRGRPFKKKTVDE